MPLERLASRCGSCTRNDEFCTHLLGLAPRIEGAKPQRRETPFLISGGWCCACTATVSPSIETGCKAGLSPVYPKDSDNDKPAKEHDHERIEIRD
jgi:hypothetical protein